MPLSPHFKDRVDAGRRLAILLGKYMTSETIVYGLPRGGVIVAAEVARKLEAPLDVVIARKIGHPTHSEYAIGAIAEDGTVVGDPRELRSVPEDWLKEEIARVKEEIKRRVELYRRGKPAISAHSKIALIIDDGIATGYTVIAAARMLRKQLPETLVIGVPVLPAEALDRIQKEVDEVVTFLADPYFLGAVGAYYEEFDQVSDKEVLQTFAEFRGR
jgi:predicted phosphoribosyltransferase